MATNEKILSKKKNMAREKVFRFKQFSVRNNMSAMKVGTDGVLLGAWCEVADAKRVLDVGTGTGLVALMAAQRCDAVIDAVEIDADATGEARVNFEESPWRERLKVEQCDFVEYSKRCEERYDVIVSNPPYFINSLECEDDKRQKARHTSALSYDALIEGAIELLKEGGHICLITPSDVENVIDTIVEANGCGVAKKTFVSPLVGGAPKRILWKIVKHKTAECVIDRIEIEKSRHEYTDDYISLTREFYLKM